MSAILVPEAKLKELQEENMRFRKLLQEAYEVMDWCRCGGYDVDLQEKYTSTDGIMPKIKTALKGE